MVKGYYSFSIGLLYSLLVLVMRIELIVLILVIQLLVNACFIMMLLFLRIVRSMI
jgi:hypothetical protein